MSYQKRVIILRQIEKGFSVGDKPLNAICRIEKEDGVSLLHLTTLNCAFADGEYFLFVIDSTLFPHAFNLGKNARATGLYFTIEPNIEKGVAVGLCSVKNDIPITVAFAKDDDFDYTKEQLKKAVAEYFLELRKNKSRKERESKPSPCEQPLEQPPTKPVYPPAEAPDPTTTLPKEFPSPKSLTYINEYDDEAVATENYYDNQLSFEQKLQTFEDLDYGNFRFENNLSYDASQTQTVKDCQSNDCVQDETNFNNGKENKAIRPYYQTVKKELTALFEKFPTEDALEKIFLDSNFVKIHYSAEKFYVVGLIKEEQAEKYICYGVPGKYSPEPPKELKGFCTFIPLSIFNLNGDGYWMMFQDAITGKCITPISA